MAVDGEVVPLVPLAALGLAVLPVEVAPLAVEAPLVPAALAVVAAGAVVVALEDADPPGVRPIWPNAWKTASKKALMPLALLAAPCPLPSWSPSLSAWTALALALVPAPVA